MSATERWSLHKSGLADRLLFGACFPKPDSLLPAHFVQFRHSSTANA